MKVSEVKKLRKKFAQNLCRQIKEFEQTTGTKVRIEHRVEIVADLFSEMARDHIVNVIVEV